MDTSNRDGSNVVHCGKKFTVPDGETSIDAITPIHPTSSYLFNSAQALLDVSRGTQPGFVYRRLGNENASELALAIAQLEGGSDGLCVASGMAAVSTSFIAAGVLSGNKRVLGPYSCYGSEYISYITLYS